MLTRRRRLAVVTVVAVALLALASRAFLARPGEELKWRTDAVSRGPLAAIVTATGTVNPVTSVQVGTYVSGPIQAIDVDFNSRVTRGQRVAKIDPRPFQLKVNQAEAALTNSRARLTKAQADLRYKAANLERNRRLQREGIVAADAIDTAESAVDQARAEVALQEAETRQAEAQLEEARVNLGYTDIVSPVDGVVVSRSVDVGQTVAASFQTPVLFVIAEDLTKMQVNANVSEADIGQVRDGQKATFTVDAFPDQTFSGTVGQVRNAPLNVQNVITYDVVIDVPNPDLALRPGMTANVEIVVGERADALRVPTAALRFVPPADAGAAPLPSPGGARVWRLEDGRPAAVPVEIGLADESNTEVRSANLQPGDRVVVGVDRAREEASTARPPMLPGRHR